MNEVNTIISKMHSLYSGRISHLNVFYMFGLFKKKIPDANVLFKKFFSAWYPEDERPVMPRPDMYQIEAYKGEPLDLEKIQYLKPGYLAEVKELVDITIPDAALNDFQHIIKASSLDLNVLDAVDKFYDRAKISALINESDPKDFSNSYLVTVCEFGAMLGYLFNQLEGFGWLYSYPYFNSIIVHRKSGFAITVFDWAVKKFSEYGVEDGFVAKFHAAIDGTNGKFEDEE